LKFCNKYVAAAPMRTKADIDTTIAGTPPDRLLGAAGGLSSCVGISACGFVSAVSATCVPYTVSRLSLGSTNKEEKSRRVGDPATALARLPTQNRLRAWRKTNESQVKNPRRHKKAGKESANHDSMAA